MTPPVVINTDGVQIGPTRWMARLGRDRACDHFLRETTVYVTLRVEGLPTASVAVTTNVLVPMGDVLMRLPLATRARTRRHPGTPIAAGIACADLRIHPVCRSSGGRRDRDRRRLLVHLVPDDWTGSTAVTRNVTDLTAIGRGARRLRPSRHIGGQVEARVRRRSPVLTRDHWRYTSW